MAAKVQGTAHLYGVDGTIAGVTVNSFNEKEASANTAQVEGETGNAIERRYDDLTYEVSIEMTLRANFNLGNAKGSLFAYQNTNYEVQSIEKRQQKRDYQMATLTLKRSEYITVS